MSGCEHSCGGAPPSGKRERTALILCLILNAIMFAVELWQGLAADSTSLIADAADFLSDAFSYGITLYVLSMPLAVRAKAAMAKAALMLAVAAGALAQGAHNLLSGATPEPHTMGTIALLALCVNAACAMLLYRSRSKDSNMRSVWLCSRNDVFNNIAVIIAAVLVAATGTLWPDLAVALFIAWIEGSAGVQIFREARRELKETDGPG